MNLNLVGKQFTLTDAIKDYTVGAFEQLEKYNLDIISARCVISADERQGKKGFVVDFSMNLPGKDTIVVSGKDKDLYAAIDSIADRASKVLRRYHDKTISRNKVDDKFRLATAGESDTTSDVDEIIPVELELYKPLEIDEALKILKDSTDQFFVFYDMDAKMRVIYKRKDGNFGLF